MSETLPVWRVFNYLAKTWYDLPTSKMDEFASWYEPSIDLVWKMANAQEIERRTAVCS
jgi:hypothetical protein